MLLILNVKSSFNSKKVWALHCKRSREKRKITRSDGLILHFYFFSSTNIIKHPQIWATSQKLLYNQELWGLEMNSFPTIPCSSSDIWARASRRYSLRERR